MSVKLIALDLDGTLVDNTHVAVSTRNIAALRACHERGICITLVSGRPLSLMTDVADKIGCVQYIIAANGGMVYNYEKKKVIERREIPASDAGEILHIINSYNVPLETYCDGTIYVEKGKWNFDGYEKQPQSFIDARAKANIKTENIEEALKGRNVEKFNIDNIRKNEANKILMEIDKFRNELTINYIEKYDNLEISNVNANKGSTLKDLCKAINIEASNVMAFGDSDNDETMLRWAGESYAMANAEQVAINSARHMTLSNEDDGVAVAIENGIL